MSNGSFSVTAGSTTIASHTGTGRISVGGGAALKFAPTGSGNSASVLAVDTASGSSVDLANDAMVVNYNGATPDTTIRAALISGRASGSWSGPGINSSVSAADSTGAHPTALGYAEASAVGITSTFFGQPADSTTVLIRYTYLGDTNLDGKVNAARLQRTGKQLWKCIGNRVGSGRLQLRWRDRHIRLQDAGEQFRIDAGGAGATSIARARIARA